MELAEYSVFADKCFRDTPPPCAEVCPLSYDVRSFIRLLQRGSYRSAYKILQTAMIFPSIIVKICPETCRGVCVRGRLADGSVDLKHLEQICVDKMAGKKPERVNIPPKKGTAAVIGAGLSGLACAYRLAYYGHPVTVYEKTGLLGGSVSGLLDPLWCHAEIEREFGAVRCEFAMGREVRSLSEVEADIIYVATGKDGSGFRDETRGGVIRAGALEGADHLEAVRQGLEAAAALDNWLMTGRIEFSREIPDRRPDERYYHLHYNTALPDEKNPKGEEEAFRCMRCNCTECYDACPLMEKHKYYPKKICNEIIITLKPQKSRRTGVRMIMGCTDCGVCARACPESIDMGKCLQEARTDFYKSGVMAPAFHDYWLADMEFCRSDQAGFTGRKDDTLPSDVLYFPGCQLPASMPELTIGAWEKLAACCCNPSVFLGCCGVPAKWAGLTEKYEEVRQHFLADWNKLGKPLVVTACPSCLAGLRELNPGLKVESYYHFAAEHFMPVQADTPACFAEFRNGGPEKPDIGNGTWQIIDPCSSVSEESMAEDVRRLLRSAGCSVLNEKPDPGCCGFGGHIYNGAPGMQEAFTKRRIENVEGPVITYCANCRDLFTASGRDTRHVLEIITGIYDNSRFPPELGERRENRRRVKRYFGGEKSVPKEPEMEIMISEELVRKLDRELILREQVAELICRAEAEGYKLYDEDDNCYIAHRKFGSVTIWAVYTLDDSGERPAAIVRNVYLHRMDIME